MHIILTALFGGVCATIGIAGGVWIKLKMQNRVDKHTGKRGK